MEKSRTDSHEISRRLDEDFLAALNMIGEGSPDYMADLEDDAPAKRRAMEKSHLDPHEIARRMDEDYLAALNMIGEGSPDYMADLEDEVLEKRKRRARRGENYQ
ncbi:MAG TPA: hypothetical protein VK947_13065 [Planococcus sp. (in: firmicutes)]|nr:hypothetical protein [Planococcus sp. (in: firmicutes)]